METRADRIYKILENAKDRRSSVRDIAEKVANIEDSDSIYTALISSTVRQDNKSRDSRGLAPRFNHSGDGNEERGYVSIRQVIKTSSLTNLVNNPEEHVPFVIEKANSKVRNQLKKAILELSWQEFESQFLIDIMEALGFRSIALTQRTRGHLD